MKKANFLSMLKSVITPEKDKVKMKVYGVPSQPLPEKHDCSVLDLAFAMDCTSSMGSYIETARNSIRTIVEEIVSSEKSDVHLALVEYRDHPPQDRTFVTRRHNFTSSVSKMKSWLDDCSAQGGGDFPEAVADALYDMLKLSWRENATKICVLISDAPPHGLSPHGDEFPNGCPKGLDPMNIVRELAAKGITLYFVGCEPPINQYKEFFTAIAYLTGAQCIPLRGAKALTQVIIGGAQEEISLERWMDEVDEEVQKEIAAGNQINDDEMTRRAQAKMDSKGIRGKKLQRNNLYLEAASETSVKLAGFANMADVSANFPKVPDVSDCQTDFHVNSLTSYGLEATSDVTPDSDVWNTVESSISYEQVSRMMQKSKSRNNYLS
ncbi:uncharacterized protein LOC110454344 [Mizuhopecten yessoensis]|uniref:Alpha-protein kinase vwkA n=1 Tax=Mizuhopecten yessoensis TaxID=6573 RepID=A0A210QFA8_MIZYE|nr:uncharacterized protein LOC110454344 [Mizuhopecten yessoensis]OWF47447.1 Alpha-protein kinase vwkA [Mizuhopecten yessoensis]